MTHDIPCPHCGSPVTLYRNPAPTADVIIYDAERGIVCIERRNPPYGWALPGGFIDYGERVEEAVVREAKEETGLDVELTGLVGVYSDPARDPRHHTMSVVYSAVTTAPEHLTAGDDAAAAKFFPLDDLPELCFDHARIVQDFVRQLAPKA